MIITWRNKITHISHDKIVYIGTKLTVDWILCKKNIMLLYLLYSQQKYIVIDIWLEFFENFSDAFYLKLLQNYFIWFRVWNIFSNKHFSTSIKIWPASPGIFHTTVIGSTLKGREFLFRFFTFLQPPLYNLEPPGVPLHFTRRRSAHLFVSLL